MSLNRNVQQKLRIAHLWLGLIAGLLIVMMGLSGVLIVFRPMIEGAVVPKVVSGGESRRTSIANLALVEQSLAAVHPGARITRVVFPESTAEPVLVQAEMPNKQRLEKFFDRSSGQELGPKKKLAWLDWIVELHQNLLMGKTGRALTGVIGVPLLLLSVSGLLSWLSGQRDWKRTLALPSKGPWRRVNYEGHKWAGLWANLFLTAVSFTGIVLAYPDTFQQAIRAVSGEPRPQSNNAMAKTVRGSRRSTQDLLALDEYVRLAATSVPGAVVRELHMPNRKNALVSVAMWVPGDVRPKGGTTVLLDPSSAKVISIDRSPAWFSSKGLVELANAIHKTELGGLPLKLAWALFGLTPLLLFLSGLQIWWNQRTAALRARRNSQVKEGADSAESLVHR